MPIIKIQAIVNSMARLVQNVTLIFNAARENMILNTWATVQIKILYSFITKLINKLINCRNTGLIKFIVLAGHAD
jgi:hypothetical protein